MNESIDAVGEAHYPAHTLIFLIEWVSAHPTGDPFDVRVARHESHDAEALASAARYFVVGVVDVDAANLADFAGVDHRLELPELGEVSPRVAAGEWDAARPAFFDHLVCFLEACGDGLFAEDRVDAGLGARDDDFGIHAHGEYRRGDVDSFVGEEVAVVGVDVGYAEPALEQIEVLGIGVGRGDHFAPGMQHVGSGVRRALAAYANDCDFVRRRCHVVSPRRDHTLGKIAAAPLERTAAHFRVS